MVGIDGVADFHVSGLDIRGGELAECLACDEQVGGSVLGAAGGEDGTCLLFPGVDALDEDEPAVRGDGSDPSDQFRTFGGLGFFIIGRGFLFFDRGASGEDCDERDE